MEMIMENIVMMRVMMMKKQLMLMMMKIIMLITTDRLRVFSSLSLIVLSCSCSFSLLAGSVSEEHSGPRVARTHHRKEHLAEHTSDSAFRALVAYEMSQ